ELMAHVYSHLFSIPTTGLRFFTVYGPWGRPDMAYFLFADAIMKEQPIIVYNQGKMKRDFTYIDDIVEGFIHVLDEPAIPDLTWSAQEPNAASSPAPWRICNIGNDNPVELMDFVKEIEINCGKKAIIEMKEQEKSDVHTTWADISQLVNNFYYKPETTIQTGLYNFVQWFKEYYAVKEFAMNAVNVNNAY
ncbi:MAG TPA: NAD-dependent epimerase/dehydratase family protein, partial [Niastella sp.]|nr:NAD-dependent epimerase/dehydratase family protein [Niastella sp.]